MKFNFLESKWKVNGSKIQQTENILPLIEISKSRVEKKIKQLKSENVDINSDAALHQIKAQQICTLLHDGVRGTYSPTDLFFIDIDTTEGVQDIIDNRDILFSEIPYICWIQKSYRNKLHMIGRFNCIAQNEEEWLKNYYIYTYATFGLIDKLFGYNYLEIEGAYDETTNQWQRLEYLSPNPLYINEYCTPVSFDKKTIKTLNDLYSINKKLKSQLKETDYSDSKTDFSSYSINDNDKKFVITKEFAAEILGEGRKGYEFRWMLVCFAKNYFCDDEKAKQWCDKHFTDKANKTIWTQRTKTKYHLSHKLTDWLIQENLISFNINESKCIDETKSVSDSSAEYCIKNGHYISEYYNIIKEHIDKYERVCIQAPTGVGKTTIINGFEDSEDQEFHLMSGETQKISGLAKDYNADVVVPFNANNYLYSRLHEVSSMNCEKYDKTKSNVMVIDQYLKHFEESLDKPVIIDESHILYMDRTYRDSIAKLMVKLKKSNKKIICISATPTGEIDELKLLPLKFTNEREKINVTFVETDNIFQSEWNIIRANMNNNKYDRIIVLDNRNNMKIVEECYFVPSYVGNYTVIRKETIEDVNNPFFRDYIEFKQKEILNKKLTLCTCVAYNGINFKNEDENILVVCSFEEGETLSSELIQIIGRVRKSKVDCLVFHLNTSDKKEKQEMSEQIENAIKYEAYVQQNNVKDDFLYYNRRLLDIDIREAMIRIDSYKKDNATINKVKKELVNTNYITLFTSRMITNIPKVHNLKRKSKESKYFVKQLRDKNIEIENIQAINEEGKESDYIKKWKSDIQMLINTYNGVDRDFILTIQDNSKKDKLIETTINYLKDTCHICTISNEDYIHYNNCMPYLINMYKDNKLEIKRISTNHTKICNMYDKWKSRISERNDMAASDYLMLDFIKEDVMVQYQDYISGTRKGGANGYKKVTDGTKTFDSVSACSEYYKVPVSNISRALVSKKPIKRGKLKGLTFSYL